MCLTILALSAQLFSSFSSFAHAQPPLDSLDVPTLELSQKNEPQKPPQEIEVRGTPGNLKISLHYDVIKYVGPSFTTTLKAYNGVTPTPTIRVKPGDVLELDFHNDLEEPLGIDPGHNTFWLPNTTK